jgi:transposase
MSKHKRVQVAAEVSTPVELPVVTRGVRRMEEKRRRRMAKVSGKTLIVGLDLAREHQAVSFAQRRQIVGRKRLDCAPQHLGPTLLPVIEALQRHHGLVRTVIGLEPAGHYWELAAESFERLALDYVLVHTVAVCREREATRYTRESTDPLDAGVICEMVGNGRFTEAALWRSPERARLNALAREYLLVRRQSAAESARLTNFWDRLLPEFFTLFRRVDGKTAAAISRALLPFSEMAELSPEGWLERLKAHAGGGRVLRKKSLELLSHIRAAHSDPCRRAGDAVPPRIRGAAERRELLEAQKERVAAELLELYRPREEAGYLDSIPGSEPLWNAVVLGLVGDFELFDSGRTLAKLAGSEVNHFASGDWTGTSRISHRGRARLRAAAYQQARALVRGNDLYRNRFLHLMSRTAGRKLGKQQAYVAVGNAYLRVAHSLVTTRTLWRDPRQEV